MQQNNTQAQDESLNSQIFKCPGCGNFLYYDPESKKMKCDYCNTTVDTQEVGMAQELPYNEGVEQGFVKWGGVKSVKCAAQYPFCQTMKWCQVALFAMLAISSIRTK